MFRVIRGLKQADHINMKEVRKQINMLSVNQTFQKEYGGIFKAKSLKIEKKKILEEYN